MIVSTPDPALDRAFAAALLRLQHDAYGTQAELVGSRGLQALAADDASLPAWRGRYFVAWRGIQLLGAVAWRWTDGVAEVDRVMVDPAVHRQGVAASLIDALLSEVGGATVETVTGSDNAPGLALYRRFGFEPISEGESPTGIRITRLRRS